MQEVFGRLDVKIPKKLKPCIDDYISKNTPAEQRTLQAAINSADNVTENLSKITKRCRSIR